ncbi:MAG: hypothetical protein D0531_05575 [Methylococcales bacterium]|nr:MAG: hypothetical protein D0531_05575 [Methylococcales bacterium]
MSEQIKTLAKAIFDRGTPFLKINDIAKLNKRWCRNVKDGDSRRGPWMVAEYEILNSSAWAKLAPCIYMVKASDDGLRYVGVSKNRLKDRWRLSPAYDESLTVKLPDKQLFHSQCWKKMENELIESNNLTFEVRVLFSDNLSELYKQGVISLSCPLAIESLLRKHRCYDLNMAQSFLPWNSI